MSSVFLFNVTYF